MAQQPTWRGHRAPVEDAQPLPQPAGRPRWMLPLGALVAVVIVAGCAALTNRLVHHDPATLPTIEVGVCLSSPDLANGDATLRHLDAVSCARPHDAEVFALRTIGPGQDLDALGERCLEDAAERGLDSAALAERALEVRPLALTDEEPRRGDTVACFVRQHQGIAQRGAVFSGSDR